MQLRFSRDELMAEHDYAKLHMVNGHRLHGGFDADGNYLSPRTKIRPKAVRNWTEALRARGGELLDADSSLLSGPRVPNYEQQCMLIRNGLSQVLWNGLTITGKIEGRGRGLATMPLPPLQPLIAEDISDMAIGHLNEGLMVAHGIDEGGIPEEGIGGHDVMWFVARDLAMGENAWPDAEPPGSIARDEGGKRRMPQIPQPYEQYLSFLMNLLLIEFRAEIGFAATQRIFRTDGLFGDREPGAKEGAEIIERIRTDELVHVESLRLYLGEIRSLTIKCVDGSTILGSELIDPFWSELTQWSVGEQPRRAASQSHENIVSMIAKLPDANRVESQFNELRDEGYDLPRAA